MPFEDFTDKKWSVIRSDPGPFNPGDWVVISGPEDAVNIAIGGKPFSETGRYDKNTHKITVGNSVIGLRITCETTPGGGSWTAEDNPSGPPE